MLYVDLSRKLSDLGFTIDRNTFDCGERITVRAGIHIVIDATAECGDEKSASEMIAAYFDADGWQHARTHASE